MTHGKRTCKILKEIRQQIADKNDIEYVTSECHFQGECQGTCPKCEAEVQFLENELSKRRQLGKAVAVAGIATVSLGMAMTTLSSCNEQEVVFGHLDKGEGITAVDVDLSNIDSILPDYNNVELPPPIYTTIGFIPPEILVTMGEIIDEDTTKRTYITDTTKNSTKTEEIKVIEEKSEEK